MGRSRWLSVLLASTLLLCMIPRPAAGSTPTFRDVASTPYEQAVHALSQIGIVRGADETHYRPEGQVTRAEMAALLVRALRLSRSPDARPLPQIFADVAPDFWGFTDVMLATEAGIVAGTAPGRFAPDQPVTHGQAVTMAVRALGYENGRLAYPAGYLDVAAQIGLNEGLGSDPHTPMTRGEAALLLANAIFKVEHGALGRTLSQAYFRHPVSIRIMPEEGALPAGITDLSLVGMDAYGNELPALPAVWRVVEGTGAVSESGMLTVTSGLVTVEASAGGLITTAAYRVVPSLAVLPNAGLYQPGDTVALRAVAEMTREEMDGASWTVLSGPGSITEAGLLTFLAPGTVVVQASIGTSRATATFASAGMLRVQPATATVAPGEQVQFTVIGPDGHPLAGPFEWQVDGAGAVTPEGLYTAAAGARTIVQVRKGDLTGAAQVQVVERLLISPAGTVTTHKSKPLPLEAVGITGDGARVRVPVTWSISGPGSIDSEGLLTPKAPGPVQVTARFGSMTESITVTVADDPHSIDLVADRAEVPANGASPVTLTATVRDQYGTVVSGLETPLLFVLSDPNAGAVAEPEVVTEGGVATATFTPSSTPGTYSVLVKRADPYLLGGSVPITITRPVPAAVRLLAQPASIPALPESKADVTAVLLDTEGHEIANRTGAPINLTLSATGASLSPSQVTINPGESQAKTTLQASLPGAAVVTGTGPYPVEPASVRITPVGRGRLVIRQAPPATADGASTMTVVVEVRDVGGRPLPDAVPVTLTALSDDGRTSLPAQRQTASQGAATFQLKTDKAGTYVLTAASSDLVGDTRIVTFTAGEAVGLRLSAYPTPFLRSDGASTLLLRAEAVDAHGNVATAAGGQVTITKAVDAGATTVASSVTLDLKEGVAEVEVRASGMPGTDGFRASMPGLQDSDILYVYAQK